MPIRPISIRNHSPTVSHRSFKLPPDGYIPTLDANSVIMLPPPHELSIPVPPTPKPSASVTTSKLKEERKKTSVSQPPEHTDQESRKNTPNPVDGDSTSQHTSSRPRHISSRSNQPTGPKSEASRASTYISESSLFGPPDDIRRDETKEVDYSNEGARRIPSESRPTTQPQRIAAKWRCVNPDMTPSPSPPPPQPSFLDRYKESAAKELGKFTIEVSNFFLSESSFVVHSSYFFMH